MATKASPNPPTGEGPSGASAVGPVSAMKPSGAGLAVPAGSDEVTVFATSAFTGLTALGWDQHWISALVDLGDPALWPARVSRVDRGMSTVMTGSAEIRVVTELGVELAVGDWVAVIGSETDGTARIVAVLPRRGVLRRAGAAKDGVAKVVAANIDTVFVCDAVDGSLGLRHIERLLALVWQSGATPVVVITKSDAVPLQGMTEVMEAVKTVAGGVSVVALSSRTGDGALALKPFLLPGCTVVLLGLSGAGKSTLVNRLAGAEILATGAVRRDGSGRHTTTHRQLVVLADGGLLIDTPGTRALSVLGADNGVEQVFSDIGLLAAGCRNPSCSHSGEPGCAIAAALSEGLLQPGRLEAWLHLRAESAPSKAADARGDIAERNRRKAAKFAARRASKI